MSCAVLCLEPATTAGLPGAISRYRQQMSCAVLVLNRQQMGERRARVYDLSRSNDAIQDSSLRSLRRPMEKHLDGFFQMASGHWKLLTNLRVLCATTRCHGSSDQLRYDHSRDNVHDSLCTVVFTMRLDGFWITPAKVSADLFDQSANSFSTRRFTWASMRPF